MAEAVQLRSGVGGNNCYIYEIKKALNGGTDYPSPSPEKKNYECICAVNGTSLGRFAMVYQGKIGKDPGHCISYTIYKNIR